MYFASSLIFVNINDIKIAGFIMPVEDCTVVS